MRLDEVRSKKLDYWQLLDHFGLGGDDTGKFHDAQLPWVNSNVASVINKLIKVEKYRIISHVRLYYETILGVSNFATKAGTLEGYEKALDREITVWRGGGGAFDPDKPEDRKWVAATTNRQRVHTFSDYAGTYASKQLFLDTRSGSKWIVEIKIPLREVLLTISAGLDDEVIIPKSYQHSAKIIQQT